MPKKKKRPLASFNSKNSTSGIDFNTLQEEIIRHLRLFKESGGLVIGCNAVIRGIEKNMLSVVILISGKATSAMYHALHLMCKDKDVLFLQLKDIDSKILNSKISSSTAYGIKKSVLMDEPKFLKLSATISSAKSYQKGPKQKKVFTEKTNVHHASENSHPENANEAIDIETFFHPTQSCKHASKIKFIGNAEIFISLGEYSESGNDFPNYDSNNLNKISICIK